MKRRWPDRAIVVSLMVPCEEEAWKRILPRVEETGADGVELNFGCPHGMSERGMGSAVGQVPEYVEMVARWCKEHTRMPVIVKLTPNITDIRKPAEAAKRGGADAVSLINTINSIMGVDLDRMVPSPHTDGKATHGGMCGPAVKPIALNMVAEIARSPATRGLPISGIGGIETWRDAAEFMALGAGTVQVCTAAMVYGFKIVQEMITGLEAFMDERGYRRVSDFVGAAVPNVTDWQYLNLNYAVKARIDQELCIKCGRCHVACEDTSHQAITHLVERRAPFRGDRRGMRRLQSLRQRLPDRELHHDGAAGERDRPAHRPSRRRLLLQLDAASEQPDVRGRQEAGAGRARGVSPERRRAIGAVLSSPRDMRMSPSVPLRSSLSRQDAVEEDVGQRRAGRRVEILVGDALAGERRDLGREVGIVLRRRPDGEDEVLGVDGPQAPVAHPPSMVRDLASTMSSNVLLSAASRCGAPCSISMANSRDATGWLRE